MAVFVAASGPTYPLAQEMRAPRNRSAPPLPSTGIHPWYRAFGGREIYNRYLKIEFRYYARTACRCYLATCLLLEIRGLPNSVLSWGQLPKGESNIQTSCYRPLASPPPNSTLGPGNCRHEKTSTYVQHELTPHIETTKENELAAENTESFSISAHLICWKVYTQLGFAWMIGVVLLIAAVTIEFLVISGYNLFTPGIWSYDGVVRAFVEDESLDYLHLPMFLALVSLGGTALSLERHPITLGLWTLGCIAIHIMLVGALFYLVS